MIRIVEFDFERKTLCEGRLESVRAGMDAGRFAWVDVECATEEEHHSACAALGISSPIAGAVAGPARPGRFDLHESALHLSATEVQWADGQPRAIHHDFVIGDRFLLSRRAEPSPAMDRVRRTAPDDFIRFSRSPGFLLYEIGDHLREAYRGALQSVSTEISELQRTLFEHADDRLFSRVAERIGGANLFRQALQGTRELFHELSHRRLRFVPESTQPHLDDLATTFERMSADLDSERQTLHELLNLYMGMVGHRTNRVINRLTVISFIFLPLTFLAGIYGMNFEHIPEFRWPWGYAYFWCVCLGIVTFILLVVRRARWWT